MTDVGSYAREGEIAVLTIDSPPVNALGIATRRALESLFRQFADDASALAAVLICGGRTFFAGADISEFGKPPEQPELRAVLDLIESMNKPVIAAIHGTALGGGYELALVCHFRVAVPSARVGLPEVNLGILPGAGGTQRLPRLVGVERALDIMIEGKPIGAKAAQSMGMVDTLAREGALREDAIAFARQIVNDGRPLVRVRDRDELLVLMRGNTGFFTEYRARNARKFRGFKAPAAIVAAVEAAVETPFSEGFARERALFETLRDSRESAAQRHYFFAEREAAKAPELSASIDELPITSVGVIGAGTMGGGIAMNFLNAGIPVTLVEQTQAALDRGLGIIRKNYETSAAKGRMSDADVEARMALISPALDLASLAAVDLVIEAVFEQMDIKQDIFRRLDAIAKPSAILATNTSYLDVDAIAAATQRPEWVIGLHFFSPANVMRLMEVVRGAKTRPDVIATAMKLARKISKVAVLSRVCHGFIANRVMTQRATMANDLVLRGPSPQDIDRALSDYGFAMGPFRMMDLVGLDVIGRGNTERTLRGDFVQHGRLGQKGGGGFYDYDEQRKATPSADAARIIADFAAFKGVEQTEILSDAQIVERLLLPVINEGAKLLDEGIALRASDVDVACILGYNWPVFTGGPMFWADTLGLSHVVAALEAMGIEPAPLLRRKLASGQSLAS